MGTRYAAKYSVATRFKDLGLRVLVQIMCTVRMWGKKNLGQVSYPQSSQDREKRNYVDIIKFLKKVLLFLFF